MRRYAAVIAIAALVAACGGTTADTDGNEAASSEGSPTTANETTEAPEPASVDDIDLGEDGELSLDDFLPGMQSGPMDEADFRAEEMAIQQQVAECMAAEGFEYIPFVPADVGGGFGYEEEDHGEWVKKYGFGISTFVLMEEEMGYDEESDPWADDPNQEIIEAMDEFEQQEYFRVLHGGEPPIIEETPWEEIEAMSPEEQEAFFDEAYRDWEPTGCMNEAYEEAYGGGEADMAFWDEFGEDFEEFWTRADADPRIVEAQAGWSACMAEKGHDFADQEEMYTYLFGTEVGGEYVEGEFSVRVNELITWPGDEFGEGGEGGFADTTVALTEEGEEGEGFEEGEFEYYGPEYDLELLQPLIDEEISLAVADWECSQDLQELFETVYKELEQEFLEENLDRLVAFKKEHS
jgi:hypothetical protein